ncbi:ThuA domain-containing protein [Wenyingzhuangia sp.]|uniref:ThuA domain-containing protein n=1 Tax=Wenyingzhuangia sp. TaxID=1964193 RepID=UPI00321AC1F2
MYKKVILIFVLMVQVLNAQKTSILVFSKTEGHRHESIEAGKRAIERIANKKEWDVVFSEDAELLNPKDLSGFDVLFFLNTSGDILNESQQNAMQSFLTNGKGFIGTHAATDTEKDWEWYVNLLGATFASHPKRQTATLRINKKHGHPAVSHLNDEEVFFDEWYNFKNPVAQHVNVLATLDESTYSGKRMGGEHPITWYHHYDGARVFYTGLGHTIASYSDDRLLNQIEAGIEWASGKVNVKTLTSKWKPLLDDDPFTNWDVFLGVPHGSVKNLSNVDVCSDGKKGHPLGLNQDPKNVFDFIKGGRGENIVHVSGEIYGALTTKQEFGNYHLKLKMKWGQKKWEPRLDAPRDSGLLYHCKGPYSAFWNVWMNAQELQIQEGDIGDFYALGTAVSDVPAKSQGTVGKRKIMVYDKEGNFHTGNTKKAVDHEKQNGKWNTVELITYNGTSIHIVNGKVVMTLYHSREKKNGKMMPLHRGRIQIQSEGAEVFYKQIKIKSIEKIPRRYQKYLR